MAADCSQFRYAVNSDVADLDTFDLSEYRYDLTMLAHWIKEALVHSGITGAELARRMTERLGRSIDRAAVNKMQMVRATAKTKPRKVSADEMIAISEITGFPLPDIPDVVITQVPLVSWVSAGALVAADGIVNTSDARMLSMIGLSPGDWIALKVEGDSMNLISPPGSIIIVDLADRVLVSGKCYVIANVDGEATYKRFRSDPMRFEPMSTNLEHETIYPDNDPVVVGRVRRTVLDM